MARAVILDFKDNDAAEALIAKLDEAKADAHSGIPMELAAILCSSAEVKALLARPTRGCKCRGIKTNRNHKMAFTRTKRFGWFVHVGCNRPAQMVVDRWWHNLTISAGNNLLEELRAKFRPVVEETNTSEVAPDSDSGGSVLPTDPIQGSIDATSQDSYLAT
jgi:hypothetical protein